jgi:hypothetical protein
MRTGGWKLMVVTFEVRNKSYTIITQDLDKHCSIKRTGRGCTTVMAPKITWLDSLVLVHLVMKDAVSRLYVSYTKLYWTRTCLAGFEQSWTTAGTLSCYDSSTQTALVTEINTRMYYHLLHVSYSCLQYETRVTWFVSFKQVYVTPRAGEAQPV